MGVPSKSNLKHSRTIKVKYYVIVHFKNLERTKDVAALTYCVNQKEVKDIQ